jgi:hypothetical protein
MNAVCKCKACGKEIPADETNLDVCDNLECYEKLYCRGPQMQDWAMVDPILLSNTL